MRVVPRGGWRLGAGPPRAAGTCLPPRGPAMRPQMLWGCPLPAPVLVSPGLGRGGLRCGETQEAAAIDSKNGVHDQGRWKLVLLTLGKGGLGGGGPDWALGREAAVQDPSRAQPLRWGVKAGRLHSLVLAGRPASTRGSFTGGVLVLFRGGRPWPRGRGMRWNSGHPAQPLHEQSWGGCPPPACAQTGPVQSQSLVSA